MADAFRNGGDKVDFRVLPAFGSEGHWLAETDGGEKIFGPVLDGAIKARRRSRPRRNDAGRAESLAGR